MDLEVDRIPSMSARCYAPDNGMPVKHSLSLESVAGMLGVVSPYDGASRRIRERRKSGLCFR